MSVPADEGHDFTVLIPARMASTRLPDKPLADLAGLPMIVRVAHQARLSRASRCVVAADDARIVAACHAHGVQALLTKSDHLSGSDRLAEACELLDLPDDAVVVNVQGDEPLMDPNLINAVARELVRRPDCVMSTAAHAIDSTDQFANPNVVKVVLDRTGTALYFSRAPIPWWRNSGGPDGTPPLDALKGLAEPVPLRHIGIYGYRSAFLRTFPLLEHAALEQAEALEQLRVLWHGHRIAVHIARLAPGPGVDTPEDLERVREWLHRAANPL